MFCCCYRPQRKLQEGNVFTGVCLFTGEGYLWSHALSRGWVSLVQGPFRGYQGVGTHPPQGWVCLGGWVLNPPIHWIPRGMVKKQVVRILLEYFLVTAHKRSLRMLCFYTCLLVILFTGGEYMGRYIPRAGTPPSRYTPWTGTPPWAGTPPREQCMLGDMGNKRTVCILLECILVLFCFFQVDKMGNKNAFQ